MYLCLICGLKMYDRREVEEHLKECVKKEEPQPEERKEDEK